MKLKIKFPDRIRSWLVLIGLMVLFACTKAERNLSSNSPEEGLEIVWETAIITEPWQTAICMTPVLIDSLVLLSTEWDIYSYQAPILFFDADNGKLVDGWDDYIAGSSPYSDYDVVHNSDYLVLGGKGDLNCINLRSRETQWQSTFAGEAGPFTYYYKGQVYYTVDQWSQKKATLFSCDIESGDWKTFYSMTSDTIFTPHFSSMGFGTMTNGDELAFWKNRSFRANKGQTDIYAYNLSADSLLWVNTDLSVPSGASNLIADGNSIYGAVHNEVFAIEIESGKMLWRRDFKGLVEDPAGANFDLGSMIRWGDYLILKGAGPELVYLNVKNGIMNRVVDLPEGENIYAEITCFEGNLYISTFSGLFIVKADGGQILFSNVDQERFRFQYVRTGYTLDTNSRLMYFSNGRHAFCAKIPDLE